ncbi:glycosyltransferase [Neolewinella litorea]|uniref:Glycosyltransferase n=1 Tax=Neolewinella litorea TaxID=2562452 RepID=A0A4S4NMT6_9BACT|nr:glycosyltransferase [Neolewinella litorea]THH41132.1 glycosyltransferase [Neolewinella litorea]
MRILFIASWWPSRVYPTHGNFVQKHARLVGATHQLTVMAVQEDPQLGPGKLELVEKHHDRYREVIVYYGRSSGWLKWMHLPSRVMAYYRAWRAATADGDGPELLHGHILIDGGIIAAILGRCMRRPVVIMEHSTRYNEPESLGLLRSQLGKWACGQAEFVLPVSDRLGSAMRETHDLNGKYRTVSNVVDTALFYPPQETGTPGGPVSLLHVSNFDPRFKNVRGILRVYAKLQRSHPGRFHLHVAGDGDFDLVGCWMNEVGLREGDVGLSGPHSEAEIAGLMQTADVFILFSSNENQPVVLLEAQCVGLPCVATPVGGIQDIVVPGLTGDLVAPDDEDALETSLLAILQGVNPLSRAAISERGRNLYGESAVGKRLNQIYEEASSNYYKSKS